MKLRRNKKLFGVLLVGLLSVVSPVQLVQAASASVGGGMTFEWSKETVQPVNPFDPSQEIETGDKVPTPGPLILSYVTDIDFGTHAISNKNAQFYAKTATITNKGDKKKTEVPNFVQVTDNRGNASGWKLYVQYSGLKNKNNFTIADTSVDFQNVSCVSLDDAGVAPEGIAKKTVVKSDAKTLLVEAKKGTGLGGWSILFGKDVTEGKKSVALTVPGASKKEVGTYQTSLTWTLEDSV